MGSKSLELSAASVFLDVEGIAMLAFKSSDQVCELRYLVVVEEEEVEAKLLVSCGVVKGFKVFVADAAAGVVVDDDVVEVRKREEVCRA